MNTNQEQKGSEVAKVNSIPIVNSVPSSGNVPKLEVRKEIKDVLKKEILSEPKITLGMVIIIKSSQRSQPPKLLVPNKLFRKSTHLGDQIESANQTRSTLMWHPSSLI